MRLPRLSSLSTPAALVGVLVLMMCADAVHGIWSAWRHDRSLVADSCQVLGASVANEDDDHVVVRARVRLAQADGAAQDGTDDVPGTVTTDRVWAEKRARSLGAGGQARIRCFHDARGSRRIELSDDRLPGATRQSVWLGLVCLVAAALVYSLRRDVLAARRDFLDVTRVPDVLYRVSGGKPFRIRMRALGYRGLGFLLRRRDQTRSIVAVYGCEDGTAVAAVDGRGMVFSTLLEDGTVVETWGPRITRSESFWYGRRPRPHSRAGVHVAQLLDRESTLGDHAERHARHVREIQKRVGSCPIAHDRVAVLAAIDRRKAWVEEVRQHVLACVGMFVLAVCLVGAPLVELHGSSRAQLDVWAVRHAVADMVMCASITLAVWYAMGGRLLRMLPWPARVPGDVLVRRERARKGAARVAAREAEEVLFHETPPKPKKLRAPARAKPRFERSDHEVLRLCGFFLSFAAAIVLCAVAASDLVDQVERARATEPAAMQVDDARTEETGSASWDVRVHVRGPIDGVQCAGWQVLPGYEADDVHQARTLADSLVGTSMTAYHPPAHLAARLDAHPRFVLPALALLVGMLGVVRLGRRWARERLCTHPGVRWFEWAWESAMAEVSASFEKVPKELGARLIVDPKLLYDARNHLPKRPPPGWSVPVASTEGDGAWMIETEEATLIVQLVRDGVRVKLTVIVMPDDMKRPDDFESMDVLRHFRNVGDFVEQEAPDQLQRDTPWVRFFLADRVEAGDPQDWPEVKVDRQLLN